MNRVLRVFLLAAGLFGPLTAAAQGDSVNANVAISVQQQDTIWVGQQVTVNLDLKTTGFSFSNTHFNLPEVRGAFLMQTDTTTIKLSETVGGESWQIVRYPLALYPQSSGPIEIPSVEVRFSASAGFGSQAKEFEFETTPMEVQVSLPPGVSSNELLVTTDSFNLDFHWQPNTPTAKTGDAVTLTVDRQASAISSMLLPALPVFRTDGMAAYPQPPEVRDETNRGDLTGTRKDKIIWVFEKPGSYNIPGIRFQWWDPVTRELKQETVPGLELDVQPPPAHSLLSTDAQATSGSRSDAVQLFAVLLATLVVIVTCFFYWRNRSVEGPDDERTAYAKMQKLCKNNQASEAYRAIHSWHKLIDSQPASAFNYGSQPTLTDLKSESGLAEEMQKLQEALVSGNCQWNGRHLAVCLKRYRQQMIRNRRTYTRNSLPGLNP